MVEAEALMAVCVFALEKVLHSSPPPKSTRKLRAPRDYGCSCIPSMVTKGRALQRVLFSTRTKIAAN